MDNGMFSQPPLGQISQPQLNSHRFIRNVAGAPKAQQFDPWMAEQRREDRLQRQSYIKNQSVLVESGRVPEAPIYGPNRELTLAVGSSLPTIYAQRITASDVGQVLDENEFLRGKVLERQVKCEICTEFFERFKEDEIREHYKVHADHLRVAGLCPLCEEKDWFFWTLDQKKNHIMMHQEQQETQTIRDFWQGLQCPVCDGDLHDLPTDQILSHMAEHAPGVLQFCDLCGLHIKDCSATELAHHKKVCVDISQTEPRNPGDLEREFCEHCGKDRTFESDDKRIEHSKYCRPGLLGAFCKQCSFRLNGLNE
jgi:hypothetical protein